MKSLHEGEPRPFPLSKALIAAGTVGIITSFASSIGNSDFVSRQLDEEFPQIVSREELNQAYKDVGVFDRKTHTLIQQGELTISIPKVIDDPQRLQRSIATVNMQQEQSDRKLKRHIELNREHLIVDFQNPKLNASARSSLLGIVSIILAGIGFYLKDIKQAKPSLQSTNHIA